MGCPMNGRTIGRGRREVKSPRVIPATPLPPNENPRDSRGRGGCVMIVGMPQVLVAGAWGLLAGGALVVGALVGFLVRVPRKVLAGVMAFGSGVLLSAVSFELIAEAHEQGGLWPTALGAGVGAVVYTGANVLLARRGARHRKRSGDQQPSES